LQLNIPYHIIKRNVGNQLPADKVQHAIRP